jgi:uncharacterized UPF0146 family protein
LTQAKSTEFIKIFSYSLNFGGKKRRRKDMAHSLKAGYNELMLVFSVAGAFFIQKFTYEGKSNMEVLIAGGAGFIGSHLARRLAGKGHRVYVIDNFSTAPAGNFSLLQTFQNIQVIRHDITEPITDQWEDLDAILDMACPASPVDFDPKAIDILRVCSLGV